LSRQAHWFHNLCCCQFCRAGRRLEETFEVSLDMLQPLLDEGWVETVIRPVKSGKEASVYLCRGGDRAGERLVAAKLYRARQDRAFKNDAVYWEGGMRIMSRRVRLAATKKTSFGREVLFGHWISRERETLEVLHAAGARVPRPIAQIGNLLAMSWIGDEDEAAPQLRQAEMDPRRAERIFDFLAAQVELWLAHNVVHGDLSEYNVLFWEGRPVVIDFPQAVDPRFNRNAHALLKRDLANLARPFGRFGVRRDTVRLAGEMWERWLNSEIRPEGLGVGEMASVE
jgi:RIO kinase 1